MSRSEGFPSLPSAWWPKSLARSARGRLSFGAHRPPRAGWQAGLWKGFLALRLYLPAPRLLPAAASVLKPPRSRRPLSLRPRRLCRRGERAGRATAGQLASPQALLSASLPCLPEPPRQSQAPPAQSPASPALPGPRGPPGGLCWMAADLRGAGLGSHSAHILHSRLRPDEAACHSRANLGEHECAKTCHLWKAAGQSHLNSVLCRRSRQAEACLVYRMKASHCGSILPEPGIQTSC